MKITFNISIVVLFVLIAGCASDEGYLLDRHRDAVDIFTATVGYGVGARARVGPVHVGAIFNREKAGVRDGELALFNVCKIKTIKKSGNSGQPTVFLPVYTKVSGEFELPFPIAIAEPKFFCLAEGYDPEGVPAKRGKGYDVGSAIPFVSTNITHKPDYKTFQSALYPYFTQIEVSVGIGGSIKLGFNPGEMFDFILGWMTIDIFNDDIESKTKIDIGQKDSLNQKSTGSDSGKQSKDLKIKE